MRRHAPFNAAKLLGIGCCLLLAIGCAKQTRKAGGHMDTPEVHYTQGMKYWQNDELAKAKEEFKLAKSLDPKFAPAYAGLALVTAREANNAQDNETMKEQFKEAHKLADKAHGLNGKIVEPYMAKAIVITLENQGREDPDKWLNKVEKQYEKALNIEPENPEVYFRRGMCYKKAYRFSEAKQDFSKVLDIDKEWTEEADKQFKIVNEIERAAPGTEVGKRIALVEKITRADIAALFISELKLDKLVKKKRPKNYEVGFKAPDDPREMETEKTEKMKEITDIEQHWARNFINDIVSLDIRGLEPYPDHTFHPDEKINRGEFAMMVEDALIAVTGDEDIATANIGESESRFPDLNPSHPAYNAICTAVDRGIMDARVNGEFGQDESISGARALLVIRKLRNHLKI